MKIFVIFRTSGGKVHAELCLKKDEVDIFFAEAMTVADC